MPHVNIAVVLFKKDVLADLISAELLVVSLVESAIPLPVNEGIVETELENKLFKLDLYLLASILVVILGWQNAQRVYRLSIHCAVCVKYLSWVEL